MKIAYLILVAFIIATLLSACGGSNSIDISQLEGHTWVLTTYNDNQPISGHQPTLQFEDGQVSGTTGCNHFGGSYQIEGDSIRFEALFNTEMACLDPKASWSRNRSTWD